MMRIVAIAILLPASAVAQVRARVIAVASEGSTLRASIEIVNNGAVSVFVQTCFQQWNQSAAEAQRRDQTICFAWPQRLVRGAWKDVPALPGMFGDYNPEQGTTIQPAESVHLEAEFSSCLTSVSPGDVLRLRIGPSPDQRDTLTLFTTSFRLPHGVPYRR